MKFDAAVYVSGRMSDQDQHVRLMATHCFATLIQLMPLDGGVPDPPNLTLELTKQKARERRFLEQLFNPKSIEDYKIPVPIQAELRSYQQVGHFCHRLRLNVVRKCFDRFPSLNVIM
jgi:TATA-binding protein-associated factor